MKIFTNGSFFENTYLLDDGYNAVLIDPGEGIDKYLDEIKKYNVVAILLTHAHVDHIDGIKYFNCPIYLNKKEEIVLKNNDYNLYNAFNKKICFDTNKLNLVLLKDEDTFELIGHKFKIFETSGHTIGSSVYLVDDKIMFSGDTLFQVGVGRTDFPTGSYKDLNASLSKLAKMDKSIKIYPGHGVETSLEFELKYNEYLKDALKSI